MPVPTRDLPRYALILAILGIVVLAFAWAAGFLSPARIGGGTIADALEGANGKVFPGFRRAHAKGLCVTGRFEANGAGSEISRAALFPKGVVPVIGRFSTGGGNPAATDGRNVFHALGLRFALPDGESGGWRSTTRRSSSSPTPPTSSPSSAPASPIRRPASPIPNG